MLLPSGNPFKYHEEVVYLHPMIPPKRFDIFSPLIEGWLEGLDALRIFFKKLQFLCCPMALLSYIIINIFKYVLHRFCFAMFILVFLHCD